MSMRCLLKLSLFLLLGCESASNRNTEPRDRLVPQPYTYLALGDSYTIGEAVAVAERWPVQLKMKLDANGIKNDTLYIIAKTGWTTDELRAAIKKESLSDSYDLVSLLIGVNNQYRGYPISQYKEEFKMLLDSAVSYAGSDTRHVIVVSIPDYGVTPFVASRGLDKDKIAKELDRYNAIADSISSASGVKFFNITPYSRKAATDSSLVASDQLHPSGKMYNNWVESVYDYVHDILCDEVGE